MPAHAAPVRREADRAADVAAQLQRGHTGRDGGRGATRGPAGGARGVPRVVGRAEDRVVGLPVPRQGRGVGLAEDHRTRTAQPPHRLRVVFRHVVPGRQPARGSHACGLVGVLDGHRHAVQRADIVTASQRRVGGVRGDARTVRVEGDDGVQWAVERPRHGPGSAPATRGSTRRAAEWPRPAHVRAAKRCQTCGHALSIKQRVQTAPTLSSAERLAAGSVAAHCASMGTKQRRRACRNTTSKR